MAIDYEVFYDWAKDRFGEENIRIHKEEICTHSIFSQEVLGLDDHKFHLWMNPSGGKKRIEPGAFRCWLTNKKGSLVGLVAKVDGISFEEAEELISDTVPLRTLERKVHEFFSGKSEVDLTDLPVVAQDITFPDFTFKIAALSLNSLHRITATKYLAERKLPADGLYICVGGDYKNRIIIPYFDREGKLIYYNARTLSKNQKVKRYMKPKEKHILQDNVLYFPEWPRRGARVYLTEGEFDALTLFLAGFPACACGGKYLSESQLEMLRGYNICLAFDADDPGRESLLDVGSQLLEMGFSNTTYVRPPKVYKDWNKLLELRNIHIVKAFVERFEATFTKDTAAIFLAQRV